MFRDGLYNLCQSSQNGSIVPGVFNTRFQDLLEKSYELTKLEIPSTKEQNIDAILSQTQDNKLIAEAAAQRAETSRIATEKTLEGISKKIDSIKED